MNEKNYYISEEGYKCYTEKYHLKEAIVVRAVAGIVLMVMVHVEIKINYDF